MPLEGHSTTNTVPTEPLVNFPKPGFLLAPFDGALWRCSSGLDIMIVRELVGELRTVIVRGLLTSNCAFFFNAIIT